MDLCGHVARCSCPAQPSLHSSADYAGCSPSEHSFDTAEGGAGMESHATALEDEEQDSVDIVQTPKYNAMRDGTSDTPLLFWDRQPPLVAETHSAFDMSHPLHEPLTRYKDTWDHLTLVDTHIHFVTEVKKIKRQRRKVQTLRIQARDERSRMKHIQHRLQEAFRGFLKASGPLLPKGNGHDSATASMQEIEAAFMELEAQDVDLDMVESTLIPAEWELKESEKQLYEGLLGPSASDGHDSEIGVELAQKISENLSDRPQLNDIVVSLPPECGPTSQERLSALARQRQEVTDRLVDLSDEYAVLQKDIQRRIAAGVLVDKLSREALEGFPDKRAQLLRELADLTTGLDTLNEMVAEGPNLMSKESDVLFRHDQFKDLPIGDETMSQPALTEGDDELHLQAHDYGERNNDMLPFMSQPILEAMSHAQGLEAQSPSSRIAQYSSVAWDLRGWDPESLSLFVSLWILECVKSSWWSLISFLFMSDLDGILSTKTAEDYIKRTWFQSDSDCTSELYFSEDPEYSGFSCALEDDMLTPSSEATTSQELLRESRPLKRRHSSGNSAATTTHKRLSNHTYPKTGSEPGPSNERIVAESFTPP
ncbi:hypothetical protein AYL99_00050 [Fonsecaea erecta]|uniref:Uncharacterized protein n=1 Tax=Fonsecaea erecta TaxID=1367422 RepID=A0A178ZW92_9EURO|nr:hypothetical protein AYL99_00050 [Fonsecaea erecta]OAP64078.1 hypothetical protein AYL99_00050 [Fonsecaea erecta]